MCSSARRFGASLGTGWLECWRGGWWWFTGFWTDEIWLREDTGGRRFMIDCERLDFWE